LPRDHRRPAVRTAETPIDLDHGSGHFACSDDSEYLSRSFRRSRAMSPTAHDTKPHSDQQTQKSREDLIKHLNEDLAREYQAIIAYVVYSQTLKGAEYMNIAKELEAHAGEELSHALLISKQIDYLNGQPGIKPAPVAVVDDAEGMLRADLQNELDTIRA